jgi:hypothetical protein
MDELRLTETEHRELWQALFWLEEILEGEGLTESAAARYEPLPGVKAIAESLLLCSNTDQAKELLRQRRAEGLVYRLWVNDLRSIIERGPACRVDANATPLQIFSAPSRAILGLVALYGEDGEATWDESAPGPNFPRR